MLLTLNALGLTTPEKNRSERKGEGVEKRNRTLVQ